MNAQEHGRKLIAEARNICNRDVKNAIKDDDYNIAVRRAQEAVELSLKGSLKFLGVDFPKVHDVGPTFVQQVRQKKPAAISDESLTRIEAISLQLSQIRTLSFYFEHGYSKEQAETASVDAAFVLAEVQKLLLDNES